MNQIVYLLGALLASVGGALSFYFHGVYSGKFQKHLWWIPSFIRIETSKCTSIVETPFGKMLGRPNAEFGIIFFPVYAVLLIFTSFGYVNPIIPLSAAILTVVVGTYLSYGLIRLNVLCRVCVTVHLLNLFNFLLQLWAFTS
ncbi:MAG: vitamin K epoxide reductase family protein [Candidatus Marinimicrobia bacterium]|nr:vitamin K epoxide reductase family protein [Candidatus Neomarinimicrobiota bacterium]MBT3617252.1 vitamin K epoxide reductase family protein [Candidatus Neomarinimicrobiota bacterium]MBT3828815.1 vitamin K epoxide reductase family protein [Candidatus Neomarinimicrobiota bacterium]MBT3997786.1 vitamin K epoxide reductase family protein [Candidatus Neomarinimicrobiota bacterium]MBT4280500.1 vitamin K epoxide reductase family protein [Candidatus Neomarinimicrobiota bacterium]